MHRHIARRELIASIRGIRVGASAAILISEIKPTKRPFWFIGDIYSINGCVVPRHARIGRQTPSRCPPAQATSTCSRWSWSVRVGPPCAPMATAREYYRRQVRKFSGFRSRCQQERRSSPSPLADLVITFGVLATGRHLPGSRHATASPPAWIPARTASPRRAKLEAQGLRGHPSNLPPETTPTLSCGPASLRSRQVAPWSP